MRLTAVQFAATVALTLAAIASIRPFCALCIIVAEHIN